MPGFENMLEDSIVTFPDVSLGSLGEGPPSTPGPSSSQPPSATRSRVRADPLSTPIASKRGISGADNGEEDDGPDDPPTPVALKTKPSARGGVNLTLREQEKVGSRISNPFLLLCFFHALGYRFAQEGEFLFET